MESGWTGRTFEDMNLDKGDWTVYMHIFPAKADNCIGHKVYVGICKGSVSRRWCNGRGYKKQHVYNAIQKYGWDNITHLIVAEGCAHEGACSLEKRFIQIYDSGIYTFRKYINL